MADKTLYRFRHNLNAPGLVRDETKDGVAYLVVPAVMLKEQVLFCSNCHPDGEFVSAEEISTSAITWNNRPITLSHPTEPWTPVNHNRLEVGKVFNVFWDGKLKGEMWLELEALRRTPSGKQAEANYRKGEVTEISTGYFVDRINRSGKHKGTNFALEQVGIVPDHLAILVGEVGACSIEGGCGAPRLNTNGEDPMDDEAKLLARILRFFRVLKAEEDGDGQSTDSDGDGDDANAGTADNSDGGDSSASASGDQDGDSGEENSDGSASSMDETKRKELVSRILNSGKVTAFEESALLAMTDTQLDSLAILAGCSCDGDDSSGDADGNDDGSGDGTAQNSDGDDGGDADDTVAISQDDADFVKKLRELSGGTIDGLSSLIDAGRDEAERRKTLKDNLVASLVNNDRVTMNENVLKGMSLEALEGFDRSINPSNYNGQGGARIDNSSEDAQFAPDAPAVVLNTDDSQEGDDS